MKVAKSDDTRRQASIAKWHHLIGQSLKENRCFKAFEASALQLLYHSPLDGAGIIEAWRATHDGGFTVRHRQIKYFELLLQLKLFSHAEVLRRTAETLSTTIFDAERYLIKSGPAKGEYRQCLEAVMLERLAYNLLHLRHLQASNMDRMSNYRTQRPLLAVITTFVQAMGSMHVLEGPALAIGTELARYLGVFINDLSITGILVSEQNAPPKALKRAFGRVLPPFINILNAASSEVAQSLTLLQQESGLFESPDGDAPQDGIADSLNAITFQQSVIDTEHVVSRAALFVFLNSMLSGRPICDDPALLTFLNSRYNGTVGSLVIDLITASFDVFANAINRNEHTESSKSVKSINIYRSFVTNKVPVLLESFSHMLFPPQTMESCIATAVRSMDPSADPYGSQDFDLLSSSGMLLEARQDFLFACALYGLIPETSIKTILDDVPMQNLPESGKYDRVNLIAQCKANPSRISELVNELENFEGQAAEITAALTQIIRDCCAGKDSITLKGICNTLSRKMHVLDVMLLFEEPKTLLQPLCELLDTWPDAEEHSEYHPVYDEFGSIFLLILVLRYRFDLQISDFGIVTEDSFIRQYFDRGLIPCTPSELSVEQRQQLVGWVKGLYDSDGNLSDEPMSTCGPKAFHLLVATLFDQSLKANQADVISFSTLQGGLGYFLEAFLLPALVTGLGWAARRLWELPAGKIAATAHLDHLTRLLATLVRPSSLSPEAKALHESVMITAAAPLEHALVHAQSQYPRRNDLELLRVAVAMRVPTVRNSGHATPAELEGWAAGTPGGFVPGIRHILRTLVAWSSKAQQQITSVPGSHISITTNAPSAPPQYTHRQIIHTTRIIGAPATLSALLDEAQRLIEGAAAGGHTSSFAAGSSASLANAAGQAGGGGGGGGGASLGSTAASGPSTALSSAGSMGNGPGTSQTYPSSLVLDVLSALLSAPSIASPRSQLTLRAALSLVFQEAYALSRTDRARAELIVRLERRVAAQCLASVDAVEDVAGADADAVADAVTNAVADAVTNGGATGDGNAGLSAMQDVQGNGIVDVASATAVAGADASAGVGLSDQQPRVHGQNGNHEIDDIMMGLDTTGPAGSGDAAAAGNAGNSAIQQGKSGQHIDDVAAQQMSMGPGMDMDMGMGLSSLDDDLGFMDEGAEGLMDDFWG